MEFYGGDGVYDSVDPALETIQNLAAVEAKRDFNIAQREAARKKREEHSHAELRKRFVEDNKVCSNKNTNALEMQKLYEEEVRLAKARKKVENDAKNATRQTNINLKEENWLYCANLHIKDLLHAANDDKLKIERKLRMAKDRKLEKLKKLAHYRGVLKLKQDQLDGKRDNEEHIRHSRRFENTLIRNEELKLEVDTRLEQIQEDIKDGKPIVAEKCSLVASITENPTVSELLAARKLQMINLEDLRGCDIEERAKINKRPLFSYVKAIDEQFEASKFPIPTGLVTIVPPEKGGLAGANTKKK